MGAAKRDSACCCLVTPVCVKMTYDVGTIVVGTELIIPPIAPPHFSIHMATTIAIRKPTLPDTIVFVQNIRSDDSFFF